jgi:DNA-binding HxlR family transcriptional regulator
METNTKTEYSVQPQGEKQFKKITEKMAWHCKQTTKSNTSEENDDDQMPIVSVRCWD